MQCRNNMLNDRKKRKMKDLFYYFGGFREDWDQDRNMAHAHAQFGVRCRYYAFDIGVGRVLDLNGHERHQNVPGYPDTPPRLHPMLVPNPPVVPRPANPGAVYGRYHC